MFAQVNNDEPLELNGDRGKPAPILSGYHYTQTPNERQAIPFVGKCVTVVVRIPPPPS